MEADIDLIEVHGGVDARRLAELLGVPFVPAGAAAAGTGRPVAVHWGPLGWALRRTAGPSRRNLWRWHDLPIPITADRRWALARFDGIVAADAVAADLISAMVEVDVTVIAGHVELPSVQPAPAQRPTVGWLAHRPARGILELLLAVRRIREGVVGWCPRCGAPAVGRLDPWRSIVAPPRCCDEDVDPLDPIDVDVELAVREPDERVRGEFERLANWLTLSQVARWVELDPDDASAAARAVGAWTAQVALDDAPTLARAVEVGAATGTPCVVAEFGATGALGLSTTVPAITRLTTSGAVTATPHPVGLALAVHQLLVDEGRRERAATELAPLGERCRPETVRAAWHALGGVTTG